MMLAKRNNNWMSNLFDDFFDTEWMPRLNATAPAVNVKETEKSYEMEVAAPGLKKEYCRIDIDNDGNLCVKIEAKFEHRDDNKKEHYLRREFNYSNYEQSYALPDDVDHDKISARVENGVLRINLPKIEQKHDEPQHRIEIG